MVVPALPALQRELGTPMTVMGAGLPKTFAADGEADRRLGAADGDGVAGSMNTVMRTIGGVVGGQGVAAILTAKTLPGTLVPSESAFTTAFWLGAGGALAAAIVALFVTPRRAAR